ncbi:hypothetical protein Fmac_030977 [Flemingia macrophylla]|uniref:Uncharacterized protein n=1 Tax=Flemingia macrophylla TaxID=520843 RepID=A0ABD1L0S7_9FABA
MKSCQTWFLGSGMETWKPSNVHHHIRQGNTMLGVSMHIKGVAPEKAHIELGVTGIKLEISRESLEDPCRAWGCSHWAHMK